MDYQEAWEFLDALQFFKIKLGLESMERFLGVLGRPQDHIRFIHVGGTNGKGSVAASLHRILTDAGYRVGLYTSPHLSSVRERFKIDEQFIAKEAFAAHADRIRSALAGDQITYFEFTTALALLWFAAEQVDVAIFEVGMGGRLDATNVITPLLSIITNVAMDHEHYLGDTLAKVAFEKAGIIKPGVPVVSGVGADASRAVVEAVCREKVAPFFLFGREFSAEIQQNGSFAYRRVDGRLVSGLHCGLSGAHQVENAALALAALELLAEDLPVAESVIRQGLSAVRWPGRLEYFVLDRRYLLDGAHNPAGAESLRQALLQDYSYDRLILVWAAMADKDLVQTLMAVEPLAWRIIFTRPENERAASPTQLRALLTDDGGSRALEATSVEEALALAADLAGENDLICVAGSLYLIGAARCLLLGALVEEDGR